MITFSNQYILILDNHFYDKEDSKKTKTSFHKIIQNNAFFIKLLIKTKNLKSKHQKKVNIQQQCK